MEHPQYLTCKRGLVGQSKGLSIPRSSVRFRLNPDNSNSHGFELHRPSNKGNKLLLKVVKAIIIIWRCDKGDGRGLHRLGSLKGNRVRMYVGDFSLFVHAPCFARQKVPGLPSICLIKQRNTQKISNFWDPVRTKKRPGKRVFLARFDLNEGRTNLGKRELQRQLEGYHWTCLSNKENVKRETPSGVGFLTTNLTLEKASSSTSGQ